VYRVVQAEGAKVLVASFDPGEMNEREPAAAGWERLGETNFYALRLNLPAEKNTVMGAMPWTPKREVAP
jgi:hypothetical protein